MRYWSENWRRKERAISAPTCQQIAKRALRFWGITSLDASTPAGQTAPIEAGDLDDMAGYMTSTLQEIADNLPTESKQQAGSAYLNLPTNVTLTATLGSRTISALTTYAAWMIGCTIRIAGDNEDNEIISSTELARHYAGASASGITATVYADCVALDETVEHVLEPVFVSNQWPLLKAQSREQFLRLGRYPMVTDSAGNSFPMGFGLPFWCYGQKPVAERPYTWFVDGAYLGSLDYLPRRLRVSPMPGVAQVLAYTIAACPPRFTSASITAGSPHTDPGVKIPIPNGWIESIYLPILVQQISGHELFKNREALPEIARSYKAAMARLKDASGAPGGMVAHYPSTGAW